MVAVGKYVIIEYGVRMCVRDYPSLRYLRLLRVTALDLKQRAF